MNEVTPEIIRAIKILAEKSGSLSLLAARININHGTLSRYISGRVKKIHPATWRLLEPEILPYLKSEKSCRSAGVIQIGGSNTGAIAQGDHAEAAVCPGPNGEEGAPGTELINPGHTVRLRSGGPLMTVLEVTEAGVRCAWFLGKDNREGSFPAVALVPEDPAWERKGR